MKDQLLRCCFTYTSLSSVVHCAKTATATPRLPPSPPQWHQSGIAEEVNQASFLFPGYKNEMDIMLKQKTLFLSLCKIIC